MGFSAEKGDFMKTQINLTTSCCDLDRFASRRELLDLLGTDGIELTCFEEDARGIVPAERVTGLHMSCLPYWVELWHGNLPACVDEFDNLETVRAVYDMDVAAWMRSMLTQWEDE